MTYFVVLIVFLAVWGSFVAYAKQEAKSLLGKYGTPLPWIRSNSIILMIRKLKDLNNKGIIANEDIGECKFVVCILKGTIILFPIIMILIIPATILLR